MTKRRLYIGFLFVVVVHWLVVLSFAMNIIPQTTGKGVFFMFHHGGDELHYFAQAKNMLAGQLEPGKYPLGFSFMLVPMIAIFQPTTPEMLIQPVAILWSMILFPVAQGLCIWLSNQLTGNRKIALTSALIFALFPIVFWIVLRILWNDYMAEIVAIHFTWAHMLSEGPTTLITLVVSVLFWRMRQRNYPLRDALLVGILSGFLVMIRYSAVITPIVIVFIFVIERQWKALVVMSITALIVFSPQMIYNAHYFGSPLSTGYTVLDQLPEYGLFNMRYFFDALGLIWNKIGVLAIIGAVIGLTSIGGLFYVLYRYTRIGSILIGGWIIGYIAFYIPYYYSWTGGMMRFLIPMLPAAAILLAIGFWQVREYLVQMAAKQEIA